MATYEPIMNALLAFIQANISPSNTFLTYRRGFYSLQQLANQPTGPLLFRQPALFLYDAMGFGGGRTNYDPRGRASPTVRVMHRSIVIYAQAATAGGLPGGSGPGPDNLPYGSGPIFHPLIEALEDVFNLADSEGAITLGGLCSHVWLKGDGMLSGVEMDPQGQGMASLPVEIMIP